MSVTPTLPICVKPYPNELLYGWLIRLAKINMYPSAESFCERYFPQDGPKYEINEHKMIRPDYRFNLDNVCKWYENIRCFSRCHDDPSRYDALFHRSSFPYKRLPSHAVPGNTSGTDGRDP